MYQVFYALPLSVVIRGIAACVLLWTFHTSLVSRRRGWTAVNAVCLILTLLFLVNVTLLRRSPGQHSIILTPFACLQPMYRNSETWRLIVMNIAVFVPIGLTLPELLPRKWHPLVRMLAAAALAFLFSALIEQAQYHFSLGTTEADDVICNTLGALIGALHVYPQVLMKPEERP